MMLSDGELVLWRYSGGTKGFSQCPTVLKVTMPSDVKESLKPKNELGQTPR